MSAHETALTFALLKVLRDRLSTAKAAADTEIKTTWRVKDRNAAVLPNGAELGSVTLAKGRATAHLADEDAFMAWVLETHPDEVEQISITRVKPDFQDRILSFARQTGTTVDPATGEEVPGVKVVEGDPYPTTRLAPDAEELVAAAWQNGSLPELIGALVQPAIEGADPGQSGSADPYADRRCPNCRHLRYGDEKPDDPCRFCPCTDHATPAETASAEPERGDAA